MPPGSMNLGATWSSLRGQWQALAPTARRNILAAAAAVGAGVLLLALLAARGPAMAPLFTNLAPADGAAIVTQLGRDKVPYKLASNGQTILVPQSQVDRLRLQMAGLGLPKSGTAGLSSVLSLPFGATDFTRQVAYQNALQGELEQTINQIQGVSGSRVQIVLPQAPTFSGQTSPASAAVLVELQPGVTLSAGQVGGIANLVAASVQGLSPKAVTVLDQYGSILWAQGTTGQGVTGSAAGPTGQAENQLQVQQQFDQTLQTNLQHLLEQVFGPGNVVTQVQAQLDWNSGTVDTTLYLPKGSGPAVVKSMQQLQQTVVGSGTTAAAGVAGTASNSFPTYPAGTGGKTSSTSNQLTQNFDVSQETQHTVIAPGSVSRLSVAVVVNSPLTAAQLSLVRATVQAAVGADPARQDQITVVGLPFNHTLATALTQPAAPAPRALPVPEIAAGAALLLILLVLLLVRRRSAGGVAAEDADGETVSGPAALSVAGDDGDALGSAISSAQAARDRMHAALRQRPEDVARVIRVWLEQAE